jgi:hypothetical protein
MAGLVSSRLVACVGSNSAIGDLRSTVSQSVWVAERVNKGCSRVKALSGVIEVSEKRVQPAFTIG